MTFTRGFHGRTADSISATFLGKYRDIGKPNVPGHVAAEFGNIESVAAVADSDTAAIMLEPIQSMAGVTEAEPAFFRQLRELCDERGIMLIFDEVQTGIGRTGNWFFAGGVHADGVVPDIISLAKSLGSEWFGVYLAVAVLLCTPLLERAFLVGCGAALTGFAALAFVGAFVP